MNSLIKIEYILVAVIAIVFAVDFLVRRKKNKSYEREKKELESEGKSSSLKKNRGFKLTITILILLVSFGGFYVLNNKMVKEKSHVIPESSLIQINDYFRSEKDKIRFASARIKTLTEQYNKTTDEFFSNNIKKVQEKINKSLKLQDSVIKQMSKLGYILIGDVFVKK